MDTDEERSCTDTATVHAMRVSGAMCYAPQFRTPPRVASRDADRPRESTDRVSETTTAKESKRLKGNVELKVKLGTEANTGGVCPKAEI